MISDDQWDRFFVNLEVTGVVKTAAAASGIARSTIYAHIDAAGANDAQPDDIAWLKRFRAAERAAVDTLEAETYRRAVEGVDEPLIGRVGKDQDGIVTTVKRYSDPLLMFLLRARDPARFKDRVAQELSGPGGKPIQTETKVIAVPAIEEDAPE